MKIRLPTGQRWTPEYQQRLNAENERAFERINEYALVPAGGSAGYALTKASDRDFDVAWATAPTVQPATQFFNGWTHYVSGGGYGPVGYSRDASGIVRLHGVMALGSLDAAAFTLPPGYRPEYRCIFTTLANSAVARLDVFPNGNVWPLAPNSNVWCSLDGISFVAHH